MLVFYYQYEGKTHIVCVGSLYPTRLSPIWRGCNTSVFMVPGTMTGDEVDEEDWLT